MSSFSSIVKDELCKHPIKKTCCAIAESYGILLFCHTFSRSEIRIVSTHRGFAERTAQLFQRAFKVNPSLTLGEDGGRSTLLITNRQDIQKIMVKCGYDTVGFVSLHLNPWILEKDCCLASFFRGIFLSGGSIVSPEKKCHLELTNTHMAASREVSALLTDHDLRCGTSTRQNSVVIYIKAGESIEDFLTLCGAPVSAMKLMQEKMLKAIRNNINRQNNFADANMDKAIDASVEQRVAIKKLSACGMLSTLDEGLQQIASLRNENPEASLTDLAELSGISRSGVYHRLRKLCALASTLK